MAMHKIALSPKSKFIGQRKVFDLRYICCFNHVADFIGAIIYNNPLNTVLGICLVQET